MNDRAITTRSGPNVIGGINAFGGAGDDVLTGSATDDVLDGGGGTDVLTGGDGADLLTDGDRDSAAPGLRPNADMLDGGSGGDTLSYARRTRGVVVDLATDDPVGEPGERDIAPGFAGATTDSPATATATASTAAEAATCSSAAEAMTSCLTPPGARYGAAGDVMV